MTRSPFRPPAATAVAILLAAAACGDDRPARAPDSAVVAAPVAPGDSAPAAPVVEESTWDEVATGPALFVPDDTARSTAAAAVLPAIGSDAPDSAALVAAASRLAGVSVDLFAPGGKVGTVKVAAANASDPADAECAPWPPVRLAATPAGSWTVAFSSGHALSIPADSLEGLPAADSAARTAQVARLASLVPGTNSREFAGLPFSVRQARRFSPIPGLEVLVAEAVRKIAQEANPREQHVLVVAERTGTRNFDLVYHETSAGGETSVETRDVLAAVALGEERRPTLVLNREYEDALAYSLLQRVGPGEWRVRWTSAKLGCEEGN